MSMLSKTIGLAATLLFVLPCAYPHGGGHPTPPTYGGPGDVIPPRTPNVPGTPGTPGTPGVPGSPGTPTTPGSPTTPGTGRATPNSRRPGGPTTPRGVVMTFERGPTSKELMRLRWDHPRSLEQRQDDGPTIAVPRMYALTREEALAKLTEEDPRPLLIYRDCGCWKDYYHTVLGRCLSDEKTQLYARFFHCVRLPGHVLKKNHTYRNLFDEERPAHMLLLSADGTRRIQVHGNESISDVWKLMEAVLDAEYKGSSERAVKGLLKLMSKYDFLDSRKMELREQSEAEIEQNGPGSSKMERLKKRLEEVEKDFADHKKDEEKLLDLGLLRAKTEKK